MANRNGDYLEVFKPQKGSSLELKQCPFCGSNHVHYVKYKCAAGECWKVCCIECKAEIDPGYAHTKCIVQIQNMWNRRV